MTSEEKLRAAIDDLDTELSILYAGITAASSLLEDGPAAHLIDAAVNEQFWRVKNAEKTLVNCYP